MTAVGDIKRALGGTFGNDRGSASFSGATTGADDLTDIEVVTTKAADDGAAATATTDTKIWVNPFSFPVLVTAARYSANGTITADNTNFATIQVKVDDGLGGASVVAAAISTTITDSGNVATNVTENLTLQSTNVVIPAGGNLYYAITKSGTGVVVRAGVICVRLTRI